MGRIKALLFDLDGTLRDSGEVIYKAIEYALHHHIGDVPTRTQMAPHIHHHDRIYTAFAQHVDKETFLGTYWRKIEELWPSVVQYEGANDLLKDLKHQGYKLAIVSTARDVANYLKRACALEYFDVLIGGNDTVEHKPSPAPVILALERLSCSKDEAVFIGDLPADIEAAKNAGLKAAIGITHGMGTKEMLEGAGADYIISSLAEFSKTIDKIGSA